MSGDRIEGLARQGVGKLQDAAGSLLGSGGERVKGQLNEAAGSAQEVYGQVKDQALDLYEEVEALVRNQPLVAAAVIGVVGLVLGLVMGGGGRRVVYVRK